MLHQLEEYVIPGGFLRWFNREVFKSDDDRAPISNVAAVVINIVFGWPLFAAVGFMGLGNMWLAMPAMGVLFVNAWFHIATSLTSNRYSPATFTSFMVLLPLTLYTFYYFVMTWDIGFRLLFLSILIGIVLHLLMLTIPRELLHARDKRRERQTA